MNIYELLNTIWQNASLEYQRRVPEFTRDNLKEVGTAITEYEPNANEFLDAIVNKIGKQIFATSRFNNKFKEFKGANLDFGDTIEEIQTNLVIAEQFDGDADQFAKNKPDVATLYHTINDERTYTITIDESKLNRAFTSETNLSRLITNIFDKVEESAEVDDFAIIKDMLSQDIVGKNVEVDTLNMTNEERAKEIVRAIKYLVEDMYYVRTEYNKQGRQTNTSTDDLILIIRSDVKVDLDVDLLAKTMNLSKTDMDARIITIDNFIDKPNQVALLIDKKGIIWNEALNTSRKAENGKALYTNYFKHLFNVFAFSLFHNAVSFTETKQGGGSGLEYLMRGSTPVGSKAILTQEGDGTLHAEIPQGVTSIGQHVFSHNQLTSVNIPDGVTEIGDNAFGVNELTNVIIPDSVTSIGDNAFVSNQLTNIIIPNSVTKIEMGTFSNNQLTSVTIGSSVISIGAFAFFGNQLTNVIMLSNDLINLENDTVFGGDSQPMITFYVQQQLIEDYKTADNWSTLYDANKCDFVDIALAPTE